MPGRHALIVATDTYGDPKLSRLRAPARDAEALADVLRDPEIGGFEVELAANESDAALRRRIAAFFSNRARDSLLLLHFSCHGLKDDSGQLYFAAADTEVAHLDATAIPAEFVSRQMARSRSNNVLMLLDCCYSGAIARGLRFRAGDSVDVSDHLGGSGRAIITASNAMEYAFEGDELTGEGRPSVFTSAVVKALETGEADRDQDSWISVRELYDYVCDEVREITPNQRPNMLSHLEGELYVARSAWVAPATLPRELIDSLENQFASVREGAVNGLAELLRSRDRGLAEAARERLAAVASEDDSRRVSTAAAAALAAASPAPSPPPAAAARAATAPPPAPPPPAPTTPVVAATPSAPAAAASPHAAAAPRPADSAPPSEDVGTRPADPAPPPVGPAPPPATAAPPDAAPSSADADPAPVAAAPRRRAASSLVALRGRAWILALVAGVLITVGWFLPWRYGGSGVPTLEDGADRRDQVALAFVLVAGLAAIAVALLTRTRRLGRRAAHAWVLVALLAAGGLGAMFGLVDEDTSAGLDAGARLAFAGTAVLIPVAAWLALAAGSSRPRRVTPSDVVTAIGGVLILVGTAQLGSDVSAFVIAPCISAGVLAVAALPLGAAARVRLPALLGATAGAFALGVVAMTHADGRGFVLLGGAVALIAGAIALRARSQD